MLFQDYGNYGGSYGSTALDPLTLLLSGSGWVVWLGMMIWNKVFNKETKAHEGLIEQLTARLAILESSQKRLESELDAERKARREEQGKVHLLELYVVALKAELRIHGIEVPPPIGLHDLKTLLDAENYVDELEEDDDSHGDQAEDVDGPADRV